MNISTDPAFAVQPRRERRRMARLFRTTFNRLARLMVRTNALRDWAIGIGGELRFGECLDPVLQALASLHPTLRDEAALPDAAAPGPAWDNARLQRPGAARTAAALAGRIMADCQACGRSVCVLLRTAEAAGDSICAHLAFALLRVLEKLLWVLRPYAEAMRSVRPREIFA